MQVFDRAPMLHVFRVDVGHDGDGGGQAIEGAVALVCLHDHPFALAHAGVGAIGMDNATIDHGWIEIAAVEQGGNHRGGCCLAVGPGDGHVGFQAHQFGKHLGPAHDGQAPGPRLVQFRVAGFDGARDHNDFGLGQVLGPLAFEDMGPKASEALGDRGRFLVRALHDVAVVEQHFGDTRHSDAADAHKVDWADIEREFCCGHHGKASVMHRFTFCSLPTLRPDLQVAPLRRGCRI